jgi:hypothetical protein
MWSCSFRCPGPTAEEVAATHGHLGRARFAFIERPNVLDPAGSEDEELDGRDSIAGRLADEVRWVLECAEWVDRLAGDGFPPVVNLRPADDEDAHHIGVDPARLAAVLRRIAHDIDELARARTVADLDQAATTGDRRPERRRRLAEPDLSYAIFNRKYRERA